MGVQGAVASADVNESGSNGDLFGNWQIIKSFASHCQREKRRSVELFGDLDLDDLSPRRS